MVACRSVRDRAPPPRRWHLRTRCVEDDLHGPKRLARRQHDRSARARLRLDYRKSDAPLVAYATVYPLTTLMRILATQVLAIILFQ